MSQAVSCSEYKSSYNVYFIKDHENNYALPYQHFRYSKSTPGHTLTKARALLSTVFDDAGSMRISDQPVVQWQGVQLYVVNQGNARIKAKAVYCPVSQALRPTNPIL